jgi:uncharacterized integral membrane protein (TIGR00698 family)
LLVAGCAIGGTLIADAIGTGLMNFAKSPVSGVTIAILLGIAIGHWLDPRSRGLDPALRFCTTWVLRTGIVLLGLKLSLAAASSLGLHALPVVLVCIVSALGVVLLVGRALRLSRELAALIAVGTSICGVTAIAATAPLIRARESEISYATACITLFGMLALLLYPFAAQALFGAEPALAGMFLGTAIHDTSQVAGAGLIYSEQFAAPLALEAATVTKLVRNLFMAAVIPLAALLLRDGGTTATHSGVSAKRPPLAPLFVLGFIGMCALRSVADLSPERPLGVLSPAYWDRILTTGQFVTEWALIAAMAAVGLQTRLSAFRQLGFKPLALGFFAATLVGVVAVLALRILA